MARKDVRTALTNEYSAGTVLFEENDPGSRMYVIRHGRVRIYRRVRDTEIVLAVLGPGDFFGEMALLEDLPRSANAQAIEDLSVIEVDAKTFEEMIRKNSEVALRIMRKLASRVRELNRRLQNLLVDSGVGRAIEVLRWLLPKGKPEGKYVRVPAATVHVNIAAQAGIPPAEIEQVLDRLRKAGCLKSDGSDALIANHELLNELSVYLDLKRKYEPPVSVEPLELPEGDKADTDAAVQRLLRALHIDPTQLESTQEALSSQFRRYVELRRRFEPGRGESA